MSRPITSIPLLINYNLFLFFNCSEIENLII
jgi:hypothetical protein